MLCEIGQFDQRQRRHPGHQLLVALKLRDIPQGGDGPLHLDMGAQGDAHTLGAAQDRREGEGEEQESGADDHVQVTS